MRFLLDHDVPERIGDVLRLAGHSVTRLREVLLPESSDVEVLDHARAHDLLLVTCNRDDFLRLAQQQPHAGLIVVIRRKTRIAECAALLRLLDRAGSEGLRGNTNFA